MSLTLSGFQSRFKTIGKLIYLAQLGPTHSAQKMLGYMALLDQSTTGIAADFDVNVQVVSPIGLTIRTTSAADAGLPATVKTAVDNYLRKFIAVDLGLPVSAPYVGANGTGIGATLLAQMIAVSASGIAMYFANNFSVVLNQNVSPSIPDSYITTTEL
jgi:hypothetical protein